MRSCNECSNLAAPAAGIDLTHYTEATRRRLYDLVVAVHFPPPGESHGPYDVVPDYSPEEAGLAVFWMFNRWLAVWVPLEDLGEPALPPEGRFTVLRIVADPRVLHGVAFHEV